MKNLKIRAARAGDREAIQKIPLSAFEEYAEVMPAHWEGYRESILTTLADVTPAEQIIAEQDGVIVGTVLLYPAGTTISTDEDPPVIREWPEARLLAVARAARARGIGTALMQECIRRARKMGAPFLSLHTTDAMRAAMHIYERMGFQRAPELDFFVAEDLIVKGYLFRIEPLALRR